MNSIIVITFAIISCSIHQSTTAPEQPSNVQAPWWCPAAITYCANSNLDPCCGDMWSSAAAACHDYNVNRCGYGGTISPWWCEAAGKYCASNDIIDPYYKNMWPNAVDACDAYTQNYCEPTIKPWWCNAAVTYCANSNLDPCCHDLWNSTESACNSYNVHNCGDTIYPWWCDAARDWCNNNNLIDPWYSENLWKTQHDSCNALSNC